MRVAIRDCMIEKANHELRFVFFLVGAFIGKLVMQIAVGGNQA